MPHDPNHRRKAITTARAAVKDSPFFLDTETTDLEGEICELCLIDIDGVVLFNSLIKPIAPITYDAFRVHGINTEMVEHCPTWADVGGAIKSLLYSRTIAIYNAAFDVARLMTTAKAHGQELLHINAACVMRLYAQFNGEWDSRRGSYKWRSLSVAAMNCKLEIPANLHRAHADAELARQVLHYMAAQADD